MGVFVAPQNAAGSGVEGVGDQSADRQVHDTVADQRCRLGAMRNGHELKRPFHNEVADVRDVDLVERAVTLAAVVAVVAEPVFRRAVAVLSELVGVGRRGERDAREGRADPR